MSKTISDNRFNPRRYCPIKNCVNFRGVVRNSGVAFFEAPTSAADSNIRQQWVDRITAHQEFKAYGYNTKIRLCQLHFDPEHIKEGRYRVELAKGTLPTIFPERIHDDIPITDAATTSSATCNNQGSFSRVEFNEPKSTENTYRTNTVKRIKCKQCNRIALELTVTNAKLIRMQDKIKQKEDKILKKQQTLQDTLSQLVPLRVEDSSHCNQNYIPQKQLKRKTDELLPVVVAVNPEKDPIQIDEPIVGDLDRSNVQVQQTEEQANLDKGANNNDDDDGDDDDSDPPIYDRQQFVKYVMSTIGDLPERSAAQAIDTIKLFLRKWPAVKSQEPFPISK